ncbi:DUF2917 domain-containing protein [Hydrogenophaga sp. BPS33]|uniref:DUF2917 domain-containing protein n=1 Tax=Hydrogenophaga sp. BPS33 TaxID=2651974 RepID=UPI00131FC5E2|nr:DUF2917 domain-containing protein [Hydrogenophaga sp. BPS33]QHE86565.1 DUF2917 domain-containing protein [Hydrogenophaga sp. BPS33]
MNAESLTVDLNMPRRALQSIPQGALRLVCREGAVWLTLDHDQQDVILNAGDVFLTRPQDRVIVYALQSAVLRMEALPMEQVAEVPRWRWLPQRLRGRPAGPALA